jgi:hypothetical protein
MRPGRSTGLSLRGIVALALCLFCGCRSPAPSESAGLDQLNQTGRASHELRRLNEASAAYGQLLAGDPPRQPTATETELIRRCCPLLRRHAQEYFALEDFVALLHPRRPWIGYHLFWDDDVDFPEDNDPTDHEVVWVEYDPVRRGPVRVATYFHGRLISTTVTGGARPVIASEWGKHGSVPFGADAQLVETAGLRRNWSRLHEHGTRLPEHPLAKGWPKRFAGDFAEYLRLDREEDPLALLERKPMWLVTPWANAAINQHFLPYCFAPKTEWPPE